jgi:hypothetical protein
MQPFLEGRLSILHDILRVTWQVAPLQCPQIWRHCSRCKSSMPFRCSMKFRINAQKKRIDVWLIYRCEGCGDTWNLPVFERVAVGDLAPDEFQAIARNDPALAFRHAFDRNRLARHTNRVEESPAIAVRKTPQSECWDGAGTIEIFLALAYPCQVRLDRLLARELGVTRGHLRLLHDHGTVKLSQPSRKALRALAADGQSLVIDLRASAIHPDLVEMIRRRAVE